MDAKTKQASCSPTEMLPTQPNKHRAGRLKCFPTHRFDFGCKELAHVHCEKKKGIFTDSNGKEDTSNLYPYQCCLWLKKKLIPADAKTESKALVKLAWGICFNSFFSMFLPLAMLFAIGHIDKKSLAATGLGLSVCNLTGMVSVIGLTAACETLCSQAYGAGHFRSLGIISQRALVISTIAILPSCALWINADKVLIAFGQDKEIAILAGQFTICYIPALFCFVLYNILVRYLACQKIVYPTVYGSLFAFLINGICCYLFIHVFKWGVRGGALAVDVAFLSCCLFILILIRVKKLHTDTWHGWSLECLSGWKEFAYLALPCFGIVEVECLSFELGIIYLGIIGRTEQACQIILCYIAGLIYFISFGISIAAAVRVGNFLGSGHAARAKRAMKISLMFTALYSVVFGLLLIALKDVIGYLFTRDTEVINMTAKAIPLISFAQLLDGAQIVLMGVVRGIGFQKYGAIVNFIGFICVATPTYSVLIFVARIGVYGFWTGMCLGIAVQVISVSIILHKTNWEFQSKVARERSGVLAFETNSDYDPDHLELAEDDELNLLNARSTTGYGSNDKEENKETNSAFASKEGNSENSKATSFVSPREFPNTNNPKEGDSEAGIEHTETFFERTADRPTKSDIMRKVLIALFSFSTVVISLIVRMIYG